VPAGASWNTAPSIRRQMLSGPRCCACRRLELADRSTNCGGPPELIVSVENRAGPAAAVPLLAEVRDSPRLRAGHEPRRTRRQCVTPTSSCRP
jgi:hypothetical protein